VASVGSARRRALLVRAYRQGRKICRAHRRRTDRHLGRHRAIHGPGHRTQPGAVAAVPSFRPWYNNVDLSAARRCGVTVTNVPGYAAHSVAEHAWAMVLHLAKRLGQADAHVRRHEFDWSAIEGLQMPRIDRRYHRNWTHRRTFGGHCRRPGCRVLAFTQHPSPERARTLVRTFVELSELLAQSDIILVHAALDAGTRGLAQPRRVFRPWPGRSLSTLPEVKS